jgi:protein-disulfide isomerase
MRGGVGVALAMAILVVGYAVTPPATVGAVPGSIGTANTSSSELSPDRLAALADYLRESGAVFYGAYWCPHCQEQKQAFGDAASRLPYVECDPRGAEGRPDLCQAAGVRAYPTWVIGGQKLEGAVSPAELGRLSGFDR